MATRFQESSFDFRPYLEKQPLLLGPLSVFRGPNFYVYAIILAVILSLLGATFALIYHVSGIASQMFETSTEMSLLFQILVPSVLCLDAQSKYFPLVQARANIEACTIAIRARIGLTVSNTTFAHINGVDQMFQHVQQNPTVFPGAMADIIAIYTTRLQNLALMREFTRTREESLIRDTTFWMAFFAIVVIEPFIKPQAFGPDMSLSEFFYRSFVTSMSLSWMKTTLLTLIYTTTASCVAIADQFIPEYERARKMYLIDKGATEKALRP